MTRAEWEKAKQPPVTAQTVRYIAGIVGSVRDKEDLLTLADWLQTYDPAQLGEAMELLAEALTRLRSEVAALQNQLTISRNQFKDAFERVAQEHNGRIAAEAELETLRRDKARLDWLEADRDRLHKAPYGITVRGYIDAAMKEERGE